jgi:EAL domain-containing protein (putative c-di-GMP-specific phosphodiesterase class I)/CRP-like cAMP-binding protein
VTNTPNLKSFDVGSTILKQGDDGHAAYIIEEGTVEISIEKSNGLVQSIGTRGAGSIIGEMALVDNKPRTATIKVIEKCTLLEITRDDFENRLQSTDPVIQMIMQVILARYRDMMTRAHILGAPSNIPTPEKLEKGLVNGTNAVAEIKLIHELKQALKNDELELHYQPIIDVPANKIAGFEALVRWNHPEKGMVYPDNFIGAAEDSGLITELSRWATKESCAFLSRVQSAHAHLNNLFMSVNFSAKDFLIPDFRSYILEALQKNNLDPDQFHIEITERLLMDQPSEACKILEDCRNAGLCISIDDFGTGYSSLSYLHYFPIDILKIDRSFITDMNSNTSSYSLVSSIISLGQNLGMSIIAEGIEEEDQAAELKNLNCDKAQGYFFSRPQPEHKLELYLSKTT